MTVAAPRTVRGLLREAIATLEAAGVAGARLDAQVLLAEVLGLDRVAIVIEPDRAVAVAEAAAFEQLVRRRAGREPVSHILGRREFWSLPFKVTAATLAPRPDSETLVAAVLDHIKARGLEGAPLRLLDLGVGSGCLILALLSELPNAIGFGVDRSFEAARVAQDNALALGFARRFHAVVGDWTEALAEAPGFDIVLSNPPYISDEEFAALDAEVALFEPATALRGGVDGLDPYRLLIPGAVRRLVDGGALALEVGAGQGAAVENLCREAGLVDIRRRKDLGGHDRVVMAERGKDEKVAKA